MVPRPSPHFVTETLKSPASESADIYDWQKHPALGIPLTEGVAFFMCMPPPWRQPASRAGGCRGTEMWPSCINLRKVHTASALPGGSAKRWCNCIEVQLLSLANPVPSFLYRSHFCQHFSIDFLCVNLFILESISREPNLPRVVNEVGIILSPWGSGGEIFTNIKSREEL